MRYQEKIYNRVGFNVRNRQHNNLSISSDICIFNAPLFDMVGAGKVGSLSASTGEHIVDNGTEIDLEFEFNNGITSSTGDTIFKFEVYKYKKSYGVFTEQPVYVSNKYNFSDIQPTSGISTTIPISELNIDGEYIIKGYYEHKLCTNILGRLELKNDTSFYKRGSKYGMYNSDKDYYFVVINKAEVPNIVAGDQNSSRSLGGLVSRTIIPEVGFNQFIVDGEVVGDLLIYLNGMLLSENLDYIKNDNIIELSGDTLKGDVITYVSIKDSDFEGLVVENVYIDTIIPNGPTGAEGLNNYYYNTTHNKYEIYVDLTPMGSNDIVVALNGVTLANNIDYYQSISNPKRIILNGDLELGDVVSVIYNAYPQYIGEVYVSNPRIYWNISKAPSIDNGEFTVLVATDMLFTNIVSSATTRYEVNVNAYSAEVMLIGSVGTNLYYKVVNTKNYETIDDGFIETTAESEIIPITIMSNAINSY